MPNPEQYKWLEKIEQNGKRIHLLFYSKPETDADYAQYSEWRSDLESAIFDFVDAHNSQTRQETIEKIEDLIVKEMLICREENTPTSRLTSLFNKLKELK